MTSLRRVIVNSAAIAAIGCGVVALAPPADARTVDSDELEAILVEIADGSRSALGDIDAVRLANGYVARWDTQSGNDQPLTRAQARQQLIALTALEFQGSEAVDPGHARRLAVDALPDEEPSEDEPGRSPLQPLGRGVSLILNVVAWVVVALIVGGVVYAIVRLVRAPRRRRHDDGSDDSTPEVSTSEMSGPGPGTPRQHPDGGPTDWADAALRAADAGDYAEALRCLHLAGVIDLDAAGRIRFDPAKTNGLLALELAGFDRSAADSLVELSRETESVIFGGRSADAQSYERAATRWSDLHSRLEQAPR